MERQNGFCRLGFNLGVNNQSEDSHRLKEIGNKHFATFLNESDSLGLKIRNVTLKQQITKQMLNCCITPGLHDKTMGNYNQKQSTQCKKKQQMTGS